MPRAVPHPVEVQPDPPTYDLGHDEPDTERYAELQPALSSTDVEHRNQMRARDYLAALFDNYAVLWDCLCTPEVIAAFIGWRCEIVDREIPSLDEDVLARAARIATELADKHARTLRQRLGAIAPYTLITHASYWRLADIWHECPQSFQQACEPLSYEITSKIIGKTLRMNRQTLPGCISNAGQPPAHVLADPGRWPAPQSVHYAAFAPARRALIALQYAAEMGTLSMWNYSGLKSDPRGLEHLTASLRGT